MKSLLFGCSLTLLALNAFGQTNHLTCKHADPSTESLKQLKSLQNHSQKSTDRKIIPVVFHVLHQNGYENINEAQIQDALRILNEDFQRLNADSISITTPFDTIRGNVNFEFRLATIEPNGSATNGIDRIVSPLTNVGNETAMLNAWDYQRYVNIWVVKNTIPGTAGFTSNPFLSTNPCTQGIVILHDYVGSIGTGNPFLGHTLTHEMGHYFGLFHTWGNQGPEQSCNFSDGINDTPVSKGNTSCTVNINSCDDTNDAASFAYWGFDPRDNIENFMEFSFCTNMFTKGQAELMRNVAESPLYGRDQLWTPANLGVTGTDGATPPVSMAAPNSNFSVFGSNNSYNVPNTYRMFCAGDNIQFTTQNGLIPSGTTTYSWSFPGGTPSSDVIENPVVNYANPGYYDVTLTATSPNGSTTTIKNAMIYVSGNWPEFTGPTVQDFNASGSFWQSQNLFDDMGYFQRIPTSGTQNTGCFLLGNHYETDSVQLCLSDPMQINQSKDNLVSPAFDLSTSTGLTVSFDLAYGSAAVPVSATEVLKVYSSRDCGKTWVLKKTLSDTALITAFSPQSSNFAPAQNQWKHISFPYTSIVSDTKTRFKFEFIASNYSNNLYIDNFVIDGVLGISDNELSGVSIFPNPSQKGGTIGISGLSDSKSDITIRDIQGKLVYQKELTGSEAELNTDLKSGCYLVEITQNGSQFLTRLIIE